MQIGKELQAPPGAMTKGPSRTVSASMTFSVAVLSVGRGGIGLSLYTSVSLGAQTTISSGAASGQVPV
jgi:hypothetical protein